MNIQIMGDYICPPVQQGHISVLQIKQQFQPWTTKNLMPVITLEW